MRVFDLADLAETPQLPSAGARDFRERHSIPRLSRSKIEMRGAIAELIAVSGGVPKNRRNTTKQ